MKKLLLFFFIACLFFNAYAQQAAVFPDLKTVVEKFDDQYYYRNSQHFLKLAKKPEGWFVYLVDHSDGKRKKHDEQMFWSAQTGRFYPLNFSRNNNGSSNRPLHESVKDDAFNYERNYYYGYNNWSNDVINELGARENLGDTLLEALGRAYGNYSHNILNRDYEYDELIMVHTPPDEQIPEAKADSFMKYADKAIETYKRLHEQNPYYETIVGNIYIKYCNEHMDAFMLLNAHGFEDKAKKYLVDGLYGPAFLSWARNYLHSVEDNAILITNGDNDTYPLIYIQQKEGFKKKVNIINNSLLWRGRYVRMIRSGYSGFSSVAFTLGQEKYNNENFNYIYTGVGGKISKGDTVKYTYQLFDWIKRNYSAEGEVSNNLFIPQNRLLQEINIINCKKLDIWDNKLKYPQQEMVISVTGYIPKNHLALIDIIYTNDWERPIYFSSYTEGDGIKIKPYLKYTGMVQLLSPHNNNEYISVDEMRLAENAFNKFSFITDESFAGGKSSGFRINAYNLRVTYMYLAYHYTNKSDTINCYKAIQKGLNIIPDSYVPLDVNSRYWASLLIELNKKDEAEKLLITLCNNAVEEYRNYKPLINYSYDAAREKADTYNALLEIEKTAVTYNFTALLQSVRAAISQLDSMP